MPERKVEPHRKEVADELNASLMLLSAGSNTGALFTNKSSNPSQKAKQEIMDKIAENKVVGPAQHLVRDRLFLAAIAYH